jgi:glucosylceramidase
MGWQEQRDFIKVLGPKLNEAGLNTKIYVFDHNYNYDGMADQEDYPVKIYADPEASKYIAGAGYHNYGGRNTELDDIHSKAPDKELIFTETSIGTWNDGQNLQVRLTEDMSELAFGTINNWCKAVIVWNLMLDSERGPNRPGGCRTCYGAVDINSQNYKDISKNSHYYVIGHLSSVVKPGATRIGTNSNTSGDISFTAFENNDNTYALVLQNTSDENKTITVSDGANSFKYDVPGKSVLSCRWMKKIIEVSR